MIEPYQVKLRTWLAGATGYAAWAPVAQDWIQNLGVDLNRAANDQRSRNEASYRPTRIRTPRPVNVRRGAEFTIGLWLSLEPTPSGFERLDRHFLRRSFEEAYKSVAGRRPNAANAHYTAAVDGLLAGNNVTEPRLSFLRNFLLRGTEPDDLLVLRNASVDSWPTADDHHLHVLSRATLLLTIASLSARSVIRRVTISPEDTRSWWQLVGSDRGVWDSQQPPLNLHDYWEDVQVELDDLQAWLDNGGEEAASLARRLFSTACPARGARVGGSVGHRSVKYMGSKRWQLQNGLGTQLRRVAKPGDRFVDLFSGSGAVSWFAAESLGLAVSAVDLQEYAVLTTAAVIERTKPANASLSHRQLDPTFAPSTGSGSRGDGSPT